MNKRFFIFLIILLEGCSNKQSSGTTRIDSRITLVNIGVAKRKEIAKAIRQISKCKPKIIAFNAVFENKTELNQDTALANSMKAAGNVILASGITHGIYVKPDSMFLSNCLGQGVIYFGSDDGEIVNKFKTSVLNPTNEELLWTFPFAVAMYFDDKNSKLLETTSPDYHYDISFSKNSFSVNSLSLDSLDKISCDEIRDKIVLMGYLGPSKTDSYSTLLDKTKNMYGTIIFANIISTILKNEFHESKTQ